jgi:hypothetical protein
LEYSALASPAAVVVSQPLPICHPESRCLSAPNDPQVEIIRAYANAAPYIASPRITLSELLNSKNSEARTFFPSISEI